MGNVFLRAANTTTAFGNFPDLVLADFGLSRHFTRQEGKYVANEAKQVRDFAAIGLIIEELLDFACNVRDDRLILEWIERFQRLSATMPPYGCMEHLLRFMSKFIKVADRERRVTFRPLSVTTAANIATPKVDDGELETIFCRSVGFEESNREKNKIKHTGCNVL